jgi:pantetheine-phosphate adenylyltransferase
LTLGNPTSEPQRVAIYPGTFDPVHLGHLDLARRAARMFDGVLVGVFDRPRKPLVFSPDQRITFFAREIADLSNVRVLPYSGLTVEFARAHAAGYLIRGLRTSTDFDYEQQLSQMNRHLAPSIETVYLFTSPAYSFLSSSLIKEVASEGASLKGLVPDFVAEALHTHFGPRTAA